MSETFSEFSEKNKELFLVFNFCFSSYLIFYS